VSAVDLSVLPLDDLLTAIQSRYFICSPEDAEAELRQRFDSLAEEMYAANRSWHAIDARAVAAERELAEAREERDAEARTMRAITDALLAAEAENVRLREVVRGGIEAMRLTRDYVGPDLLPEAPGWSWFDWTTIARAALVEAPMASENTEARHTHETEPQLVCETCGHRESLPPGSVVLSAAVVEQVRAWRDEQLGNAQGEQNPRAHGCFMGRAEAYDRVLALLDKEANDA